jgi:phage-related tail fiber protein
MSQTYFTILTNLGAVLLAQATASGTQLKITHLAVGDGNGNVPSPLPTQTQLIHEVRRSAINTVYTDENNENHIIIEQVIPPEEGGFYIRELGVFDDKGNLIAVGNCPPSYKPKLSEGSGRTQVINMVIMVDNTGTVELKIDASTVLATRKYVDDLISSKMTEHEKSTNHPNASTTGKGFVQLNSAINSTLENQAATPKAVKTAYDLANTANTTANTAKTNAATAQTRADSAYTLANTANTTANTAKSTSETDASTTVKGRVQLNSAVNSIVENQAATPKAVKTAYDLANTSNTTANTAKTNAATAQTRADSAYTLANTANTTANTAKSTAETDASTTVKGRVQLNSAVNSAVENQAATPKAVKTAYDFANGRLPLTGGTVTGTTNFTGKLQQAGSDVITATSIKSLFENKLTDSGYQKLPNGLIIQWQNNFAPTTGNISLPISFPNKGLALVVGNTDRQGSGVDNAYGYIVNNSTVFIALKGQNNTTNQQYKVSYIVIGY